MKTLSTILSPVLLVFFAGCALFCAAFPGSRFSRDIRETLFND